MLNIKPIRGARVRTGHPLAQGLFAGWLLSECGGTKIFDGVERRTGILRYGVTWQPGRSGPCLKLDGTSGYVDLAAHEPRCNAATGFSGSVRLRFWQLPAVAGTTPVCLDYRGSAGRYWYLRGRTWDNRFDMTAWDDGQSSVSAVGPVVDVGRWYDVTFVFDGRNILLYVDGRLWAASFMAGILAGMGTALRIGHTGAYSPEASFEHVMFWDRALTGGQVRRLHREPYGMFEETARPQAFIHVVGACGGAEMLTDARATAGRLECGPWLGGRLAGERAWLRATLFGGCDGQALALGTALSGGWFWMRRNGCTALYRGRTISQIDFDRVLNVAAADAQYVAAPRHSPHNPDVDYYYVVRRFNGLGIAERTLSPVRVSVGADGGLEQARPNRVFALNAHVIAGARAQLRWLYEALGQADRAAMFNVYGDGGGGQVDFDSVIGTVTSRADSARRFCEFVSEPLATGRHPFVVRAATADGVEGPGLGACVDVSATLPPTPEIVGIQAQV
ncbi:MAG TPA: LamG domain-containing protein [Phycisphaerales bacterium]|nr:LamG domain-containing protein [Phycisphaerales bacterium]